METLRINQKEIPQIENNKTEMKNTFYTFNNVEMIKERLF